MKPKKSATTLEFPALFARLYPDEVNGRRGYSVRCSARAVALGFIWWTVETGTTVIWHWRTGENFGERTTQRAAVQALRDIANQVTTGRLPRVEEAPRVSPTPRREVAPAVTPDAPVAPPAPRAPSIVWDDSAPAFDIVANISASLKDKVRL